MGGNIPENCVFLDIKAKILAKTWKNFSPKNFFSLLFFHFLANCGRLEEGGVLGTLCICYLYYFLSYVFFLFCKAGKTRVYVLFPNNVSICDFFLNCNTYLIYSTYAISLQYVCNTMCNLHHSVSTIINYWYYYGNSQYYECSRRWYSPFPWFWLLEWNIDNHAISSVYSS